jgi:hypothetical protein
MSKAWMKKLRHWMESDASKGRRYHAALADIEANPPEGHVSRIIERLKCDTIKEVKK